MSTGKTLGLLRQSSSRSLGMAVGMVIASRLDLAPASSAQTVAVPAINSAPLSGPIDATTFRNIAKLNAPAVVNIQTEVRARNRRPHRLSRGGGGGDDLLRRFFGGGGSAGAGAARPQPHAERPQQRGARDGRRRAPASSSTSPGSSSRTTTSSKAPRPSGSACMAPSALETLRGAGSSATTSLTDTALLQLTEMPRGAADRDEVRRFRPDAARRLGHGDRQSVPARPQRQRRRDQRARPSVRRGVPAASRTCSRPTRRSTRATPAARCSTCAARWSA